MTVPGQSDLVLPYSNYHNRVDQVVPPLHFQVIYLAQSNCPEILAVSCHVLLHSGEEPEQHVLIPSSYCAGDAARQKA